MLFPKYIFYNNTEEVFDKNLNNKSVTFIHSDINKGKHYSFTFIFYCYINIKAIIRKKEN